MDRAPEGDRAAHRAGCAAVQPRDCAAAQVLPGVDRERGQDLRDPDPHSPRSVNRARSTRCSPSRRAARAAGSW
jgi:hypothetical protein